MNIAPRRRGYGEPRIDLTPLDLFLAGYIILPHTYRGWCYRCPNPYGTGIIYGVWHDHVEDAIKDARRMMAARSKRVNTQQLELVAA